MATTTASLVPDTECRCRGRAAHLPRRRRQRAARILLVHDNASFRDFVRALGMPATTRVVPEQPAFPPTDEFVRVAGQHNLLPIGPPMSVEDADATLTAADRAAVD